MFAKQNRLRRAKDFERVFKTGRSSFDKLTGIKITRTQNDFCRFGVIVSTKVNKSAVKRNLIKRRVRFCLRSDKLFDCKNIDCVVIVLPAAREASYAQIKASVEYNLRRLGLLLK